MITVLGYGKIGKNITNDLLKYYPSEDIVVYDPNLPDLEARNKKLRLIKGDPFAQENRDLVFRKGSVIVSALPPELRPVLYKTNAENHSMLVDIAFGNDDSSRYYSELATSDYVIIPDAGVAPGISNLLVGRFTAELEEVDDVRIYVGGIPERPIPPIEYKLTFSSESLVDEYINDAKFVRSNKIITVEALSGVERFSFEGVEGELEAFYTDGLRTLLENIKAKNMFEKTVRYRGHAEKIKMLRDLGLFESTELQVDGAVIRARRVIERLFDEKLAFSEIGDILMLKVIVSGKRRGNDRELSADLLYRVPGNRDYTAMSMTTGSPASILAQLLNKNFLKVKGFTPLEVIGKDVNYFEEIVRQLRTRGIEIKFNNV